MIDLLMGDESEVHPLFEALWGPFDDETDDAPADAMLDPARGEIAHIETASSARRPSIHSLDALRCPDRSDSPAQEQP